MNKWQRRNLSCKAAKKKKTEKEKRKKEEGESYGDEKSSLRPPATHISLFVCVIGGDDGFLTLLVSINH